MTTHPDELTGTEQAVLLVLMAECRPLRNSELTALGPELKAEGRRRLNSRGLVESTRVGRGFVHELTDDGWATARRIIGADAPPRSTGQGRALYTVLRGLDRYLDRLALHVSDVFGAVQADPEQAIRAAYGRLAQRPGGWVALVSLRAALPEFSRTDIDEELRRMFRITGVHLIPEENQKVLTDADRAAALDIGDQARHLIAIEV